MARAFRYVLGAVIGLVAAATSFAGAGNVVLVNPKFASLPAGEASKLPGWKIATFHGTPMPAMSFEQYDASSFVRFTFSGMNPNRELIFSVAQSIDAAPAPDQDFQIQIRYRVSQKLALYTAISAGQGCHLPYVRASLPTDSPGTDLQTATVDLSAFRFQDSNVIWNHQLWIEVFTVGHPAALPATLDLADISISVVPSAVGLRPVTNGERVSLATLDQKIAHLSTQAERDSDWLSRIRRARSQFDSVLRPDSKLNDSQREKLGQFNAWANTLADAIADGSISRMNKIVAFEINPISNQQILPDSSYFAGNIDPSISAVSARNATIPIGVVATAEQDCPSLLLTVLPFRNASGTVEPRLVVNRKLVKGWYQDQNENWRQFPPSFNLPPPAMKAMPVNTDSASFMYSPMERTGMKVLTPELLVNDYELVETDPKTRTTYVRSGQGSAAALVRVDDPAGVKAKTLDAFRVIDSKSLLPVPLKAHENQQFWIDVTIPPDVAPGIYHSEVHFSDDEKSLGGIPIMIDVRPTVLAPSDFIESIYYHPVNYQDEPGYTVFYPGDSAWDQTRLEFEDLARHGIDDVLLSGPLQNPLDGTPLDLEDFARRIKLRKTVGLRTDRVFYTGLMLRSVHTPEQERYVREQVRRLMAAAKAAGVGEVYVYSQDEANGEALASLRKAWEIAHEEGAKVFAAGSREDMFPLMGDELDLFICAGYPDRREAKRWQNSGKKIACYSNPQGGLEQPDTYRRNYGILLWQNDYDGAAPYTYHTAGRQFDGNVPDVWDDYVENPDAMKQLAMVYPTAAGVIDTIEFKGLREGYTDIRYLHALQNAVNEHQLSEPSNEEARAWLATLKAGDINRDHFNPADIRMKILDFLTHSKQDGK